MGHSRPGRACSKFGRVRYALKAEVFENIKKDQDETGSMYKEPGLPDAHSGKRVTMSGANGSAARMEKTSGRSIRRKDRTV
jgi:hypothetical protein